MQEGYRGREEERDSRTQKGEIPLFFQDGGSSGEGECWEVCWGLCCGGGREGRSCLRGRPCSRG